MSAYASLLLPFLFAIAGVAPGWLGIFLEQRDGAIVVTETIPDSPAAKAGIRPGDRLLQLDGKTIETLSGLQETVGAMPAGRRVTLTIGRGDRELRVDVVLGRRPAEAAAPPRTGRAERPRLGVELAEADGGLRVAAVEDGSPAARAGLRAGMRLLRVGDRPVRTLDEVTAALAETEPGRPLRLQAEAGDQRLELNVEFGTAARPGPEPALAAGEPPAGFQSDFATAQAAAAKQGRPLVVVFGASWCGSCKALERAFADRSLRELLARVVCVWVDTDQHGRLADQHQIQEIPHLRILGPDGRPLVQHVGYAPPATLAKLLAQALESHSEPTAPVPDEELQQEIRRLRQEIERLRAQLRRLEERAKSGGR